MSGNTIGERLGAPKHGYIPPNKRERKTSELDLEQRKSAIMQYVREHEGQPVVIGELMVIAGYRSMPGIKGALNTLERDGKIRIDRSNRLKQRFYLVGEQSRVTQERLERLAEEAKTKRVEAHKLATALLNAQAWEFLKQYDKLDSPNPVVLVRDLIQFISDKSD